MFDDEELNYAKWKFEKIQEQIKEFEEDLDDAHDAVIQFPGFGVMYVDSIGYQNPDILCFYGKIGNAKTQIIQHINQLNLALLSVEKCDQNAPSYRMRNWIDQSDDE